MDEKIIGAISAGIVAIVGAIGAVFKFRGHSGRKKYHPGPESLTVKLDAESMMALRSIDTRLLTLCSGQSLICKKIDNMDHNLDEIGKEMAEVKGVLSVLSK